MREDGATGHGRVVVIEDSDEQRELVVAALADEGFEVVACANPIEALPELERGPPAAIVLDWYMPLMGGAALVALIRGQPALAEVPVVVLTGAVELRPKQVDAVLYKPVDLAVLIGVVRQVIEESAAPPERRIGAR